MINDTLELIVRLLIAGDNPAQVEADQKMLIDRTIFRRADGAFQCTKCNYSSKNGAHVRRHVSLKHLDLWPFSCTLCSASYKIEELRIKHYQTAHNMQVTSIDIRTMQAKMFSPYE